MQKKPIRLFVSDMDGTLLRTDFTISSANVEAIHKLKKGGLNLQSLQAEHMMMPKQYVADTNSIPILFPQTGPVCSGRIRNRYMPHRFRQRC